MQHDEASVAERTVERSLARRQAVYAEEVRRLIAAGVRVMQRSGSFAPRVEEIVGEAGLSNQVFYRHFRSKDEFLLAVLDDGVRELVGYLEHRMAAAESARDRVRSWIDGVLAQGLASDAAEATRPFVMPQARLAERFPDEVARSVQRLVAPLASAIAEGERAGELQAVDPERDARALYDLAMGWLQRKLLEPERPTAADAAHLVEFAMRGLTR